MSADRSPSPQPQSHTHTHLQTDDSTITRRRDRPPALDVTRLHAPALSRYERSSESDLRQSYLPNQSSYQQPSHYAQPHVYVSTVNDVTYSEADSFLEQERGDERESEVQTETEGDIDPEGPSRPLSTTSSSLDPYYFGVPSPTDSPSHLISSLLAEPAPSAALRSPTTPETRFPREPATPARDPAALDRRGLIGVGELATPRWTRAQRRVREQDVDLDLDDVGFDSERNFDMDEEVERVGDGERERDDGEESELPLNEVEKDVPDSPWTIEAVDGESDEKEEKEERKEVHLAPARKIRPRVSLTEESGGEEILYPRKPSESNTLTSRDYAHDESRDDSPVPPVPALPVSLPRSPPEPASVPTVVLAPTTSTSPPSAFVTTAATTRRAKKRSSDQFEMDQSGALVGKRAATSTTARENDRLSSSVPAPASSANDRASSSSSSSARKHRSLGVGVGLPTGPPRDKGKERRRESLAYGGLGSMSGSVSLVNRERHMRQASASSSSSSHAETHHPRRVHTTDFSHLPPSPSTSSIQHFLRHAGSANSSASLNTSSHTGTRATNTPPMRSSSREHQSHSQSHPQTTAHASPSVAHSLLRGTQEGWSGLDDEATAEALRKIDGLTGKMARARGSVGSLGRPASSSRPGTPSSRVGVHWEGVGAETVRVSRRASVKDKEKDKENVREAAHRPSTGVGLGIGPIGGSDGLQEVTEVVGNNALISSDEQAHSSSGPDKTPKKASTASARLSFTPKRGSASSTTYTGTPTSSRDSASLSTATSVTSVSAPSGRFSSGKVRRNSAGSDISSLHAADSTAAAGEAPEEDFVPPVPPLPKDLSNYRSPPQTAGIAVFSPAHSVDDRSHFEDSDIDRTISLEVHPPVSPPKSSATAQQRQSGVPGVPGSLSAPETAPSVTKTPSKKWSFTNALNIKLSSSPSVSSMKDSQSSKPSAFPLSPRSVTFSQSLRKSNSKDQALSPSAATKPTWSPVQPDAMGSVASLASMSSVGSTRTPKSPGLPPPPAVVQDRGVPSRTGTASSASVNTTSALSVSHHAPLSPSSSVRRHQSKRLTPSSIPFFRRSSSQSMQLPPSTTIPPSMSPSLSSGPNTSTTQVRIKASTSPSRNLNVTSQSVPGSAHKKSSMLSLGLPSLLKGSSSRRSLHGDKSDSNRDIKEVARIKDLEKEKQKQDQKDRSESRISVLIGRKRGKTLSSADPKKTSPVVMPPMQMSALPPATAQRVASLKSTPSTTPTTATRTTSSSRLTSQTVSSMQKQSDASLRNRNQLPTIAGSPSVGANLSQASREPRELPPSSLLNSVSGLSKETPTKIPRISSRTSTTESPTSKNSTLLSRRVSLNVTAPSNDPSPIPVDGQLNEFGVLQNAEMQLPPSTTSNRQSIRASPTSTSTSRVPRQVSAPTSNGVIPRKSNRDSVSFSALRKSSTGSVASGSSVAPTESHHRFSALSPSKGLKLLSPKISLSSSRSAPNNNSTSTPSARQAIGTPSSSRHSLSTPSPAPSPTDEEERAGDEEMVQYIKRQQAKKLANGATQEELDKLLKFPEPISPTPGSTPDEILTSSASSSLSPYEREEILNFSQVYCIGAGSQKKHATMENSGNNHGYDDDRGDYLVVNHDHLAYRYEVIDTLGKGSFGQVLHCRDHCTGESVAIKIIRNKKRFHHQALVEIKILDNLRKWDPEEKHYVIKMTEYFYFRNHLCIAMELLSINLYELIKANGFAGFTTTLIRRFTNQMLMSLCLMRQHRIVHCDLKPENVLLRHPAKSAIKVIDFGSSCFEHEKIYTYIQSRFYRSPEVILGMNYHMAIDMWSLGCILAELHTGYPIFPGENEQEQLSCIMEILGIPDKEFVNRSSRKKLFFDNNGSPRPVVNSKGKRRRPGTKTLAHALRSTDEDFIDFIAKCLVWDPERRIKPQVALQHAFIRAGRRSKTTIPSPSAARSLLSSSSISGSRSKPTETPKKSQISAPTPLAARSSRATVNTIPSTPVHATTLGSSRSFRASQSQGLSSHYTNRTLGGLAVSAQPPDIVEELTHPLQASTAK